MLAALLDAHSAVEVFFEPFNAHKRTRPTVPETVDQFRREMATMYRLSLGPETRVTGFKETAITPQALDWAEATVRVLSTDVPVFLLWIVRDPVHTYLSRIDGARKWWGQPNASFSQEGLARFLGNAQRSVRRIRGLYERFGGAILSYEALAESPERALGQVMRKMSLPFEPRQLNYYTLGPQQHKVMGDVGVATNPRPLSADSVRLRDQEAARYDSEIQAVKASADHRELLAFCRAVRERGFVTALSHVEAEDVLGSGKC